MANSDHLARLLEGVESWNDWMKSRLLNQDFTRPNLSGANLKEAHLSKASRATWMTRFRFNVETGVGRAAQCWQGHAG